MDDIYKTDLTDGQWRLIEPILPEAKPGGRPRSTNLREVINAIFYQLRTGCQWDMLPRSFPPKSTIYDYFSSWKHDGTFDEMGRILREQVRVQAGRNPTPTAAIVDSQTVKTAGPAEQVGYDGGKKIKGRKRHIAVDVLGLLLVVVVHSAGIQDRAGAKLLMQQVCKTFALKIIWADGGYTGNSLVKWIKNLCGAIWQVIKRPRGKFQVVKFRWIVERTFGWMNYQRRLSKDYEYSVSSAEAWVKLAAINMMVRRLSPG
tara:strand:- start:191 stop:967 length:777 start_codon:yes stop_codon:yes gene_type:complete